MLLVMSGNNYAAAATVAHSRIFSDNNNSSTGQYLSFPRCYTPIVCYISGLEHCLNLGSLKSCQTDCREALDPVAHSIGEQLFRDRRFDSIFRGPDSNLAQALK